jgi:pyruvate/2-oxoacid:ferredoxin oxidoreductase alpha subunit/NAD-dependent dihydropyrimidine dehydrogenase PreA subunit
MATATAAAGRPKPLLLPQYCKACGRCIEACPKECFTAGTEIDPISGLAPVAVDLSACNGCGLCFEACPEPFGLLPMPVPGAIPSPAEIVDPETLFGPRASDAPEPVAVADERLPLPRYEPLVMKGNHAAAVGALLAGCRHFFGYPITPSTEGAELMARLLPRLGGTFVQAVSEVAAVNMMYGCGGAGLPAMTFTSSPGFSLMLEGISYMIGAEIPGVFVNVMRGGPGLGNIAPEQGDIKLVCRGLGHGNTFAPVLAPASPQEMLDLTRLAFELAFAYRTPVVLAGDGYLGQITGRVELPRSLVRPGLPAWAVWGDRGHRRNLLSSIYLSDADLEAHNERLNAKYERIRAKEQRAELVACDDADWLLVACNTPARMAQGAVAALRERGVEAGLFRPITLWPFPIDALAPLVPRARGLVVVEAGAGQLEDELRLALSWAQSRGGAGGALDRPPRIERVRRHGGVLPQQGEIVAAVAALDRAGAGTPGRRP